MQTLFESPILADLAGRIDEALQAVVGTALTERLDLMNTRAVVNDAWRQLAIFANALLGTFDVAYHLDSRTPPNEARPLAFSGPRTRHQLIFNAELPLVRKVERNNYRASLIAYQRERRNLMATEDLIANAVRSELRALRVLRAFGGPVQLVDADGDTVIPRETIAGYRDAVDPARLSRYTLSGPHHLATPELRGEYIAALLAWADTL